MIKEIILYIKDFNFYINVYLMFSIGIMAVLGFVFWMIASRMYSTTDIRLGTTIISARGL